MDDLELAQMRPYAEAVTVLAEALDRLGARIHRDLHVESSEGAPTSDQALAATLVKFSAYTDECLEALDDARVLAALTAAKDVTAPGDGPNHPSPGPDAPTRPLPLGSVRTEVRHGLSCERCGLRTRTEWDVLGESGAPPIAVMTGCSTCHSGMYRKKI